MLKQLFCKKALWPKSLCDEFDKPYMRKLDSYLTQELLIGQSIYPPKEHIFEAFYQTSYDSVKVVLVGQDPYHGPGQADGLAFSVSKGKKLPPSLKNIFQELQNDLNISPPPHGNLLRWAKQGVLLLNITLTVQKGQPQSHAGKGWEIFTYKVIEELFKRKDPLVFVLWGKSAQKIDAPLERHLVLRAAHPSPFSAHKGFFGCQHFSKTNAFLEKIGKTPIDWKL